DPREHPPLRSVRGLMGKCRELDPERLAIEDSLEPLSASSKTRDELGVAEVALRVCKVLDLSLTIDSQRRNRPVRDLVRFEEVGDVLPEIRRCFHEDHGSIETV